MDRSRTSEPRLSLAELTEAAGVSVRTVRYYIAEGLLPPPHGSGPASFYVPAHLERLQLIGRLKDAYLPLKEIRRRLDGVEDPELPDLLQLNDAALFDPATWEGRGNPPTVRSYAERVRRASRPAYLRQSSAPSTVDRKVRAAFTPGPAKPEPKAADALEAGEAFREHVGDDWGFPAAADMKADAETDDDADFAPIHALPASGEIDRVAGEAWRRLSLGDEIELMVSDRAWRRNREKLEWLANWARKVLR
jgi:DNA-binding transcriptional MerR regulator